VCVLLLNLLGAKAASIRSPPSFFLGSDTQTVKIDFLQNCPVRNNQHIYKIKSKLS
jgi:hypothetical protein